MVKLLSNIISKIHEDMDDYAEYCKILGKTPKYGQDVYGNKMLACYSKHATKMKRKVRALTNKGN
jgi:hypothetical protein